MKCTDGMRIAAIGQFTTTTTTTTFSRNAIIAASIAIIVDDVPAGSPLKDLDGKTVKGTKENMENLSESIGEKMKEVEEKDLVNRTNLTH